MRILILAALLSSAAPAAALADAGAPAGGAPAGGGISVQEYQRVRPPAPVDVRADIRGGRVTVSWSPPPAVAPTPAYDAAVATYRVYRVGPDGSAVPIGETAATSFRDPEAGGGLRRYAVTAVQRSGQESGLSAAAEIRVP